LTYIDLQPVAAGSERGWAVARTRCARRRRAVEVDDADLEEEFVGILQRLETEE